MTNHLVIINTKNIIMPLLTNLPVLTYLNHKQAYYMPKIYRVFFCFLLFSFTAVSADEDHLESVDEELIVISSRIRTVASEVIESVDSISSQDIDLKLIDGLAELVRFIPGVSAQK